MQWFAMKNKQFSLFEKNLDESLVMEERYIKLNVKPNQTSMAENHR